MKGKAKRKQMKSWVVPVRQTLVGEAIIEAEDAVEAWTLARRGQFAMEPGASVVDWEVLGAPKENV